MWTLALDTTAEFGSLALLRGEDTVAEVLLHSPEGFSGILFGEIDKLLDRESLALSEIGLFAGAAGPGSFTGVRVGLAAIKGLADVLGKPAIAVSNLEALSRFGTQEFRATLIDARRGEVFAAVYSPRGMVIPEQVLPFPRFLELLGDRPVEWISTDLSLFQPSLIGAPICTTAPRAMAGVIGRIAVERLRQGDNGEPAVIEANYVRRSDAELLWKEPPVR